VGYCVSKLGVVEMDTIIKILLIERQRAQYELISLLLGEVSHVDYQLEWSSELDASLERVLSDDFDVILLDYHWGDCTGRDLLTSARAQGCKVPIIVMTDEMEAVVDREAIRLGASDYLIKGRIECQLLERTIRYAIERKCVEYKLAKLAHYDPLTNIPNRILFRDRLDHAVSLAERDGVSFTLMYLDLNGFKQINDSFGHDAGDELIRLCAQRLESCMRRSDSVARIGGDEFTLLLENTDHASDIAHIAEKVLEAISRPYRIGTHSVEVGASIGIAIYPQAGLSVDELQKHADMAMYDAKLVPGDQYRFFTEALNVEARRQLQLESELRRALRRNEFVLFYQPRVDLRSGEVVGLEALLRWSHPERGMIYPDEFIAAAEDTGLIVPLGYWVLLKACEDLQQLRQAGAENLTMAVNLSLRQFKDERLPQRLSEIILQTGVQAQWLEFEITETAMMENVELVREGMEALASLGCRFNLDDFGTGYSSFTHLQRLPISAIKIDKTFVAETMQRQEDAALVAAMVNLGHSLGKEVIAEGVESDFQRLLLTELGCDQVQGYYFCKPMGFSAIVERLCSAPGATRQYLKIAEG